MLDLAILGLLQQAPMHGYELRKRLAEMLGSFRSYSYGSLYPTLKKMVKQELIVQHSPQEGAGRGKKVYHLTDLGKAQFDELINDACPAHFTDDGFGVHLAFFEYTRRPTRIKVLEGRRRVLEDRRNIQVDAANQAGCSNYSSQLHQISVEHSERELRWINDLIYRETAVEQPPL